jgi:integrase
VITGFLVKKPDSSRRTFQIVPYEWANGKKVYSRPLEDASLAALNKSLRAGTLTEAQALLEIKTRLLPELRRRLGVPERVLAEAQVSENNLKVFKQFWSEEYRRAKLEYPPTVKHEFIAALRILEPLSLHTCTADELQDHWDKKESGTRHKRYGNRVNQLLRFLKRGFELRTDRAVTPPLKWVTWLELEQILEHVQDEQLRDLYRSLYGTGARLGEMLALEEDDVRANGTVYICKQIDRDKRLKPYTKNKKSHDTLILREALPAVKRWAKVPNKAALRSRCQKPLIEAALKTFPSNPTKQISPHKLRSSYVKQMLTLGVPLHRIALFLGDLVSTLETSYRQWVVSDAEIDFVKEIMDAGYERLNKKKKGGV